MVFTQKLSIAIPASLVSGVPHKREKTLKVGMVGRAAAIFGVSSVIVFPDMLERNQSREIDFVTMLLSYMETPQYLRKQLFKISPALKFAGVLPPLRTPHHPLHRRLEDLVNGEFREGATVSHVRDGTLVNVGVERNALVRNRKIPVNTRVTVKLKKIGNLLEAIVVSRKEISEYWGYRVTRSEFTLGKLLKKRLFDLTIATSKFGQPLMETSRELMVRWKASRNTLLVFGSPTLGLYELASQENLNLDDVTDYVVNVVPRQKTETVRTEEALIVTLGIFNLIFAKG